MQWPPERKGAQGLLLDPLQARIGTVTAAHFAARLPVHPYDVGREVEAPLEQARPHPVHVHRHVLPLDLADLPHRQPAPPPPFYPPPTPPPHPPPHPPPPLL